MTTGYNIFKDTFSVKSGKVMFIMVSITAGFFGVDMLINDAHEKTQLKKKRNLEVQAEAKAQHKQALETRSAELNVEIASEMVDYNNGWANLGKYRAMHTENGFIYRLNRSTEL